MKKNENGFSVLEVLIVFLIIGLIGGSGWYVWQTKNNKTISNNTGPQNHTNQTSEPTAEFIVPEGWIEHRYTRTGISFWAPKDWKAEELEKINQVSIDAPGAVTAKNVDGKNETFRLHINIASPSANSLDKIQKTPNIFSSSSIVTGNLLRSTYLTLKSPVSSVSPGVDSFIVTHAKYSTSDKSFKPALLINGTSYEIWGGIFYEDDDNGMQPRLSLEKFNRLDDFQTAQDILKSIKPL